MIIIRIIQECCQVEKYLPKEFQIFYQSKDNRQEKTFDALDRLVAMTSPIPDQPK